jgi:hypothetical protein
LAGIAAESRILQHCCAARRLAMTQMAVSVACFPS